MSANAIDREKLRSLIQDMLVEQLEEKPEQASPEHQAAPAQQKIITRDDLDGIAFGGVLKVPRDAIVTALARETAAEKQILITAAGEQKKQIALGADHGGFETKNKIKASLERWGYETKDFGTFDTTAVDYPDFALAVAMSVARKECECGIIVDGAGIGSCMAANKVPGVRAALCYDEATARNSREHNFANVLTLGGRMHTDETAQKIVKAWLETPFGEERHARRVRKIMAIEAKYLRRLPGE
jgi:ribose 5-phosphate isomerase B